MVGINSGCVMTYGYWISLMILGNTALLGGNGDISNIKSYREDAT